MRAISQSSLISIRSKILVHCGKVHDPYTSYGRLLASRMHSRSVSDLSADNIICGDVALCIAMAVHSAVGSRPGKLSHNHFLIKLSRSLGLYEESQIGLNGLRKVDIG